MSKIFSTLFDNFRAAPVFRPLLGGSDRRRLGKQVSTFIRHTRTLVSTRAQNCQSRNWRKLKLAMVNLASRKRCDLKTRKRCDFFSAAQRIASDFSAISSAIFRRFFCDFCSKTCDLVLCDLKTQRFFCDCDFLGR